MPALVASVKESTADVEHWRRVSGEDMKTKTHFKVAGADIEITLEDLRQIRKALDNYFAEAEKAGRPANPSQKALAGSPSIDDFGVARIGNWLLEARSTRLVLTHRHPWAGKNETYEDMADIEKTKTGWRIISVGLAKIRRG